ncbi:cysteine--1-D-myo-inosityl 2-amino-2-deoxy-alpha-D-glucopyranoside ligase [Spiractinospora alimapuensis]|uniref:cysteine--1-D-myo-inosityl 2-amino-2-deoxy-alpha-D-glucopyranoside ligase n=1 Tax=Spiractinospora alimapuensis TaxID=2820884 RepID=UPI001EEA4F9E|nr:cysteine--1-D-myo-inosityl 2-amino-2-deoxy-alpha-D-glucopyranoside ligase [Spiractinospora alimapuensis]QVQ52506.1 cysteine--1-D-myo-inosityl 2-amino-2-deoxy-alpha-D-glucopyranoside ligase [Spiractinospora alimapuensis]
MQSWSSDDVPRLDGTPRPLRLNSAPQPGADPSPAAPGTTKRLYVCGITPYDAAHLGHAFTYLTFDLLNRVWRDAGAEVHYVQNVTDIDDPLLERAAATGEDWRALAAREIDVFRADMEALRVLPPRSFVGVVESIDLIADLVQRVRARGAAYELEGDVYFSVASAPHFGAVSGLDRDTMLDLFGERGGDPTRAGKKDPLDWLLWRAERPGEPAWDSPLGRGRPGWHVECSAISLHELGSGFDVNGGGVDLVFPHHEMGAAEAECATGHAPQAQQYCHVAMVGLDGDKMSKSQGNLVFVSGLRAEGADPMAIRLALLDHHYATPWDWTADQLDRAVARLARWRSAVALPSGEPGADVVTAIRAALSDDLNAPAALTVVDRWAARAIENQGGTDPEAPDLVRRAVDALLGVAL